MNNRTSCMINGILLMILNLDSQMLNTSNKQVEDIKNLKH
jgi:hypothetical protein